MTLIVDKLSHKFKKAAYSSWRGHTRDKSGCEASQAFKLLVDLTRTAIEAVRHQFALDLLASADIAKVTYQYNTRRSRTQRSCTQ